MSRAQSTPAQAINFAISSGMRVIVAVRDADEALKRYREQYPDVTFERVNAHAIRVSS